MNWWAIAEKGVIALAVAIIVWLWQEARWETKLADAPILRDTVVVRDTVTLPPVSVSARAVLLPEPRFQAVGGRGPNTVGPVTSGFVDSLLLNYEGYEGWEGLARDLAQVATFDTVITQGENSVDLGIRYTPLDHLFEVEASFPPYKRVIITNTKTIYSEPEWWQYALLGTSALVTGVAIEKEDGWMLLGGAAGVTIAVLTF